jgi:endothelin-converting enzyme/putative endopeptidase
MVQDIKNAMRQDIDAAPWMSGETKKAAMVARGGRRSHQCPGEWRDYSSVRVRATMPATAAGAAVHPPANLAKIGKPVDRSEWSMTPPTVNAYTVQTAATSTSRRYPPAAVLSIRTRRGGEL